MTIPAGTVLHLRWAAANIDPDEFECPFELRLDRKAVTRHLTFSAGPRVCPGAGISRIEQQVAWERLTERLSDIQYAPENKLLHQPGIMLGTLKLNLLIEAAKKGVELIVFNIYQIFARLICSLGDRRCSILLASLIPFS